MSLDWDLIWTILQVVALLIIAREIDKRIRKRKKQVFKLWLDMDLKKWNELKFYHAFPEQIQHSKKYKI